MAKKKGKGKKGKGKGKASGGALEPKHPAAKVRHNPASAIGGAGAGATPQLKENCRVKIHSLQSRPELNGTYGIALKRVDGSDPERWEVMPALAPKAMAIKAANLTVLDAPATADFW